VSLVIDDTPSTDPTPLEWWAGRVIAGKRVRSWLPDVFERYARILHPAYVREETPQGIVHQSVTWRELGRWSGKALTAETCIDDLLVRGDGLSWTERGSPPKQGQLDPKYMRRLVTLLAPTTDIADAVWFLVWAGYGSMRSARREEAELEPNTSWRGTGRTYLLFRGTIGSSVDKDKRNLLGDPLRPMRRPPSFWWPMHRSWFVSTDIDSFSTHVGGSTSLISRLLEDDVLEAVPVRLDDLVDSCADEKDKDAGTP